MYADDSPRLEKTELKIKEYQNYTNNPRKVIRCSLSTLAFYNVIKVTMNEYLVANASTSHYFKTNTKHFNRGSRRDRSRLELNIPV